MRVRTIRVEFVIKKEIPSWWDKISDAANRQIDNGIASLLETRPDGIGLFAFSGWRESLLKSIRSLIT